MATSGTATFNPDFVEIFEEAFERAGAELRSGNDYRTARRSFNLLMSSWANRGLNFWTIEQDTSISIVSGTSSYNLPADTVDVFEAAYRTGTGTTQQDLSMTRMPMADYAAIPNKNQTGQPLQFVVQRNTGTSTIILWPAPSAAATLVLWHIRRIEDAGNSAAKTADVPYRFIPALCAGLAHQIGIKKALPMDRLQMLKADAMEEWRMAWEEDRDKSSWYLRPSMRAYTNIGRR